MDPGDEDDIFATEYLDTPTTGTQRILVSFIWALVRFIEHIRLITPMK